MLLGTTRAWVVHGADGIDELTTTGYTKVSECRDGAVNTFYLHPADVGLPKASAGALQGGDAQANARIIAEVLAGVSGAPRDVVHTIPVLNRLRRRYPDAQIDWLVTPPIAELLRHHPAITNVIEFAREEWSSPWRLTPFANYASAAASRHRMTCEPTPRPAATASQVGYRPVGRRRPTRRRQRRRSRACGEPGPRRPQ